MTLRGEWVSKSDVDGVQNPVFKADVICKWPLIKHKIGYDSRCKTKPQTIFKKLPHQNKKILQCWYTFLKKAEILDNLRPKALTLALVEANEM